MRRGAIVAATAFALAGCGGSASNAPPTPPKLPHALAQLWATRADAIAAAASSGNGCAAQRLAQNLRDDVIGSQSSVPLRYRSILLGAVNDLADRISCVTVPAKPHPHPGPKPKPPKHDHKGPG